MWQIIIQGGSNMTGTNCDLFTHKSSRSYLNHLVIIIIIIIIIICYRFYAEYLH